jgi:signal transduction histidine kinase/CheY-like chemotaxis protein
MSGTPENRFTGIRSALALALQVPDRFRSQGRMPGADRTANLALGLIVAATVVEGLLLLVEFGSTDVNSPFHVITSIVLLVILLASVLSFALLRRRVEQLQKLSASMETALRAKEAAEAANLVKARYLANVSHEIRSPLNAIYGYAQLVEQQGDVDPKQAARVIRRCSEHITSLAESLLDISQLESGLLRVRSETVNLPEFLDQISWMMRPSAEAKGLTFALEMVGRVPDVVRTDPGRLRQALLNIIGNAIKFTASGGVTMRVSYRGQIATISISDTGPGISPEDQERIFEPFTQLDVASGSTGAGTAMLRPGVGLGLPITKAIIEILGGNLQLESTPGVGTCFTATLMLSEPINALRADAVSRRITGYEGTRRTILVVDDEADQRALLEHYLTDCGFTVVTAPNGEEALAIFPDQSFDLVLLDISMPGLTGWETAARIREIAGRQVLIAMASANVHEFHRPDFYQPTHDHFFIKPYRLEDLSEGIGALLGLSWQWASTGNAAADAAATRPGGLPPRAREHVERLRERIHIGHVRGIEAEIALLANAAPEHGRLVTALYAALDEFDLAGLLRLLEDA